MTVALAARVLDAPRAAPRAIVLVGPLPPPSGGMANQTQQLAGLLEAEGCSVTVVRTNAPYRPSWIGLVHGVRALFRLIPYIISLWRAMREADLVHVMANSGWAWHLFAAPAIRIAALRGMPILVNYRGGDAAAFLARRHARVRATLAKARMLIVPSGFLVEVFARHGLRARIVPNIVDVGAFHPAPALPAQLHVVVTRNLEPIYDIATALRAFAIVRELRPDARMTVAGSGPERSALEGLAAELGVAAHVRFSGRLDNAEVPALYRTASIALNPSRVDNMPISLLEAMASGVPIVSTDVGGVPFMVEDERTALLVPAGDPRRMAEAVLRLYEDRELARRIVEAARGRVPRYAWSSVRAQLFEAYASVMAGEAQQVTP
jgi:glycosyltransferase involved in cell wall biosynthesis